MFGSPWEALVAVLAACALPTAVWRLLGVAVGRRLDEASPVFVWVRAVATAIIGAFVARVILFPTGSLAEVALALRLGAVVIGIAAYRLSGRSVIIGVLTAVAALALAQAVATALA